MCSDWREVAPCSNGNKASVDTEQGPGVGAGS